MTETQVWLARGAYERLTSELAVLLRQRADGHVSPSAPEPTRDGSDPTGEQQMASDRRELDQRIRKLQMLLQDPIVGEDPPDDGVAEPGMVLTVRYEDDHETETFLMAHDAAAYPDELMICSPDSPLGAVLLGAQRGDRVTCRLPNGQAMDVTLLDAAPYRAESATSTV